MSELSTVAIKDGHRGHLPHHHAQHQASGLSHQLDAERADRISRLAGLERVTTARNPQTSTNLAPGGVAAPGAPLGGPTSGQPVHGYFDSSGNPAIARERSTVGSASATGSVGQHTTSTTWGAGTNSDAGDTISNFDRMSEDQSQGPGDDDLDLLMMEDARSVGGMSDEGAASLVGFGEGARTPARQSVLGAGGTPTGTPGGNTPTGGAGSVRSGFGSGPDARLIDGMTYDPNVVDTTAEGAARARTAGTVRGNMDTTSADRMRRGQ